MSSTLNERTKPPDCVVGIGASAGGVTAFKALLPNLPVGKGFTALLDRELSRLAAWTSGMRKDTPFETHNTGGFNTLFQHFRRKTGFPFELYVDLDAIRHARKGICIRSLANSIPKGIREKFLDLMDGTYRVQSITRDMIVFSDHDLLQDPPFSGLDLISCRNVLTFFRHFTQKRMLAMFHYSLNQDGYLLLGFSEAVGQTDGPFPRVDADARLYMRRVAIIQQPRISRKKCRSV